MRRYVIYVMRQDGTHAQFGEVYAESRVHAFQLAAPHLNDARIDPAHVTIAEQAATTDTATPTMRRAPDSGRLLAKVRDAQGNEYEDVAVAVKAAVTHQREPAIELRINAGGRAGEGGRIEGGEDIVLCLFDSVMAQMILQSIQRGITLAHEMAAAAALGKDPRDADYNGHGRL